MLEWFGFGLLSHRMVVWEDT